MEGTATSKEKVARDPSKVLLGRWETNTVLGDRVFVVLSEVANDRKAKREAVLKLFVDGADVKGLTAITLSSNKPVSVRECVNVTVTL